MEAAWTVLVTLWRLLEASWKRFDDHVERRSPKKAQESEQIEQHNEIFDFWTFRDVSWEHLGGILGSLGNLWSHLGRIFGDFGLSWEGLGDS